MSSGSAIPQPPRRDFQPAVTGLVAGQICFTMVSIQAEIHRWAQTLAADFDLPFSTPAPTYTGRCRPCVFVEATEKEILVYPLSTLGGTDPATWNLLQQAVAQPFGDTITDYHKDSPGFQTQPPWTHRRGLPTYVVACLVRLPLDAPLHGHQATMDKRSLFKLHVFADMFRKMPQYVIDYRRGIQRMLQSYEKQPTYCASPPDGEQTAGDAVGASPITYSSLNPAAPVFVPRKTSEDLLSYITLELAAESPFGISAFSSFEPPLHDRGNLLLPSPTPDTPTKRLRSRRGEEEKENHMRP